VGLLTIPEPLLTFGWTRRSRWLGIRTKKAPPAAGVGNHTLLVLPMRFNSVFGG
jgi:hypothetical protein